MNSDTDLAATFARVHDGPLEDFVRRRDSAAKDLRAAGDREAAAAVKALRKPSRIAWALNRGTAADNAGIESLAGAVTSMLETQASGGDVRSALAQLRAAVRDVAEQAAQASRDDGHPVDAGALGTAVLAVIAGAESFAQLRGGYLSEIPEAGGLDFLSTLPMPSAPSPRPASRPSAEDDVAEAERAARALAEATARAEAARRALAGAEAALVAAEERLLRAEEDVRAARKLRDRARQEFDAAADAVAAR